MEPELKVFIWNTEYQVLIGIAPDVEKARRVVYGKWKTIQVNNLTTEADLLGLKEGKIPSHVYYRATSVIKNYTEQIITVFTKEPDSILDIRWGNGLIYDHSNE